MERPSTYIENVNLSRRKKIKIVESVIMNIHLKRKILITSLTSVIFIYFAQAHLLRRNIYIYIYRRKELTHGSVIIKPEKDAQSWQIRAER